MPRNWEEEKRGAHPLVAEMGEAEWRVPSDRATCASQIKHRPGTTATISCEGRKQKVPSLILGCSAHNNVLGASGGKAIKTIWTT